jgi:hypothetical protein
LAGRVSQVVVTVDEVAELDAAQGVDERAGDPGEIVSGGDVALVLEQLEVLPGDAAVAARASREGRPQLGQREERSRRQLERAAKRVGWVVTPARYSSAKAATTSAAVRPAAPNPGGRIVWTVESSTAVASRTSAMVGKKRRRSSMSTIATSATDAWSAAPTPPVASRPTVAETTRA